MPRFCVTITQTYELEAESSTEAAVRIAAVRDGEEEGDVAEFETTWFLDVEELPGVGEPAE